MDGALARGWSATKVTPTTKPGARLGGGVRTGNVGVGSPVAFLIMVTLLGGGFVAIRYADRELPPFSAGAIQFALAATLLAVFMVARRLAFPRGRALGIAVAYGALNFGVNFGLLFWGIMAVPAGMSAVIFATMPLSTLGFAVALGLERFTKRALFGALLALGGVAIVFTSGLRADLPPERMLAIFVGSVAAAAGAIIVKRFPPGHPVPVNAVGMAVAAAMLAAAALLAREAPALPVLAATWGAMLWLVAGVAVAFSLRVWLLGKWSASTVSYQAVVQPLFAVVIAAGLVGERPGILLAAGSALVFLGLWLAVIAPGPRASQARQVGPPAEKIEHAE